MSDVSWIILEKRCWKEAERNKKAGRIPVHDDVGSAKNLFPKRQRNAQQDTKTQWSLLVFRCLGAKEHILKLGGFTFSFAEITDEMSTETGFREGGIRFQNTIYPHVVRKSRRFSSFFGVFIRSRGKKDALRPRVAGGGFAASVSSLALASFLLFYREPRTAECFLGGKAPFVGPASRVRQKKKSRWTLTNACRGGRLYFR